MNTKRSPKLSSKTHISALRKPITLLLVLLFLCSFSFTRADNSGDVIRVGWVTHPGLQEYENGVYSGYTYDYLAKVAEYTGWTYDFVPGDLTVCLSQLEAGEIDIVGGLLYSEEREQRFGFPQSDYGQTYKTLFTAAGSDLSAYDFEAFDGMSVGMVDNATVTHDAFGSYAAGNGFSYTEVMYADIPSLLSAVQSGEVDAGMLGAFQAADEIKILAEFSPSSLYFAVTRGNDKVLSELGSAMSRIQTGTPYLETELYKKHFASVQSVKLTDEELAAVEASKVTPVALGIIPGDSPTTYWDEKKGEYVGIYMDLLEKLSQYTGLQFEYIPLDLTKSAPLGYIKSGYPKLVAGMLKTDAFEADEELILSDALDTDSLAVAGRMGHDYTKDPQNKTIAVMTGFQVSLEYVEQCFPQHKVVKFDTLEECLDAVTSGKADAAVHLESCIKHLLQNPHYERLDCNTTFTKNVEICIVGQAEGSDVLMSVINKGLATISDSERTDVIINFTTMNPYRLTLRDSLYKYRIPLFVIAVLIVAVIATLVLLIAIRRKSEKKTQEALRLSETANRKMNEALALAQEASAAKGNFMSRMSHEIRTPLNAIIGYNIIANGDITEAKTDAQCRQALMKVSDCLTKSNIASKHLLTIINDVLDMSAIESGKIKIVHERFDFKSLVSSITTVFYSQAKSKGVDFEVVFDSMPDEWLVGDQMRTNQILANILSNAVKFTSDGGRVQMFIREQEADDDATHIVFTITDTGIGMSPEYVKHIWDPFEQADSSIARRFGGTGLGLSITKNLVDLMGGTIEVQSRPTVGSTFTVTLPFKRTEQPESTGSFDFSMINALVVDDDAGTCDYICLLMERFGAHCTAVTSGADAVDAVLAAQTKNEPFTVCLVDWRMPKMNGLETAQRIREVSENDIPIIVITAYDFTEIVDKAAEAGITKFISKPLFQSSLFDLLAGICGEQPKKPVFKPSEVSFSGERVLLAEDNAMNMEIAQCILESAGLSVDCAYNGAEAVELFKASAVGTYKAILMDIQMPVMDGHLATRTIRACEHPQAKSIPIIAMTADAFSEDVAVSLSVGMNDHISKPIDLQALLVTLKKYICE